MLDVLKLIFKCMLQFIYKLFQIDVGFTNLGTVLCIVYILLPMLLVVVNFLKTQLVEELDERYDEEKRRRVKVGYIGKHEHVGRHTKQYFDREKRKARLSK